MDGRETVLHHAFGMRKTVGTNLDDVHEETQMPSVTRTTIVEAPASIVWGVFSDVDKWSIWDTGLETSSGEFVKGGRVNMTMGGITISGRFEEVIENKTFTMKGSLLVGLLTFRMKQTLTPQQGETKLEYEYGIYGLLGNLLWKAQSTSMVQGTEKGLANIKRLSEEAVFEAQN